MDTYKNTGYSTEKFNSIISQLNDRISCDSECEKNLHAQKLKQSWTSAIKNKKNANNYVLNACLLYTSPSPRDRTRSRMPSSA